MYARIYQRKPLTAELERMVRVSAWLRAAWPYPGRQSYIEIFVTCAHRLLASALGHSQRMPVDMQCMRTHPSCLIRPWCTAAELPGAMLAFACDSLRPPKMRNFEKC
jgi:hypothetical protein